MGDEQRAPVPRDAGRDEPARGLQRLRDGRGRPRPRARTSSGIRAKFDERRAKRTPFERAMLRLTGHGPQARAVQEGRDVRPGDRGGARPEALTRLWDGPETLPRDGRDRGARSAGSPASSTRSPRRSPARHVTTAGPGSGPGGAPTAIALSPILSARYRSRDLERIRAAAPGARLVTVSVEGLADGPLDDVEVMLRGWLSSDAFDRLLARAPQPRLGPLGDVGRRAGPHPGVARARPDRHQRARRVQPADRRVRADDDPGGQPAAAAAARAAARADVAAARGRRAARRDGRHRRAGLDRPGGRGAGHGVRLPGGGGPPPAGRGRRRSRRRDGDEPLVRRADARSGRRPGDAAGAARRIGLHRARGAADAARPRT